MGVFAYLCGRGGARAACPAFIPGWDPTPRDTGWPRGRRGHAREPLRPTTPPTPAWQPDDWRADPEVPREAPRLNVELVPAICWGRDPLSYLTTEERARVRSAVARDAGERCEVCSADGSLQRPLECHQVWQYEDVGHLQTFARFIALCAACHQVLHLGHARAGGREAEVTRHLAAVNGWTRGYARRYIDRVVDIWRVRSEEDWTIDLSAMSRYGVPSPGVILSPPRPPRIRACDRINPDGTVCLFPEWGDDTTTPDGTPWWPLLGDVGVPRGVLRLGGGHPDPEEEIGCLPA